VAKNLIVNDEIFVPVSKLPGLEGHDSALYRTRVAEVKKRQIKVQLPNNGMSDWIGSGNCQRNVGIMILSVGDLKTETSLLDPLAKSILQYCRLLVRDDSLRAYKVRSKAELEVIWKQDQAAYSHVVIIGHGSKAGIKFSVDDWVAPDVLAASLNVQGAPQKIFVSLCCQTGFAAVGKPLSKAAICSHFLAPFHDVHGAVASQFAQTFLALHLLSGESAGVAFKHARKYVSGSTSFRLWQDGELAQLNFS
jgi:hypothetical protein